MTIATTLRQEAEQRAWELQRAFDTLKPFLGTAQIAAIKAGLRGEEREHFREKLEEYAARVTAMPVTYEQDGLGLNAVAHLHYFTGSCDWYITERDIDLDREGQHQAYGVANLGYGAEPGYISIVELVAAGAELDLWFTPAKLREIEKART